jgi:DNA-binding CsgD family transcriptional regulator
MELLLGNWSGALADIDEAAGLARDLGYTRQVARMLAVAARIQAARGRADECLEAGREAVRRSEGLGLGAISSQVAWARGLLALGQGQPDDCLDQLATMVEPERWPDSSFIARAATGDLVEAAVRAGRAPLAARVLADFASWAGEDSPAWATVIVHRGRALLVEGPKAAAHFETALSVPGAEWRPFEHGRTHLLYGEWLRRERRRIDARGHLRAAVELFDRLGAADWSERARSELRATGETVRRHDPSLIDQLTPQELQIVRLAAAGMTNREIGARLFLSPRTIGSHLYSAFPKLGVGSRAELRTVRLDGARAGTAS